MANFSTHLVGAVGTGVVCASLLSAADVLPVQSIPAAVGIVALGGLFPDVDSDASDSIELVFTVLGVAAAIPVLIAMMPTFGLLISLGAMGVAFAAVRYLVVEVFRRFTVHRGIFHSVPMAILWAGVVAMVAVYAMDLPDTAAWVFAALFFIGCLTHLVLDEMYSVDLGNRRIKRSFGTALKLFDRDHAVLYVALYGLTLGVLVLAPDPSALVVALSDLELRWLPTEEVFTWVRRVMA